MSVPTISLQTARRLACFAQGLLRPPSTPATIADVKDAITRLGMLQIDTINVVARAPFFSLFSRLGEYEIAWVNQLLEERQIFEYWAHAACFLPIEDYPLHRRLMLERFRHPYYFRWYENHKAEVDAVLDHIRLNGAAKSADFERKDGRKGSWWDWKIEKDALEFWLVQGDVMITRRENFQRVYDLRERVLPDWDDRQSEDLTIVFERLVEKSIAALGFAIESWVWDYFRLPKKIIAPTLASLQEKGRLMPIQVAGWPETAWVIPEVWESFQSELQANPEPCHTTLLTPFDSLVCDRARARRLFDFDFTIECYLPASKRKYGYFLLPILHDGNLVGRLDAKAHRESGRFEIKSIHLEEGVALTTTLSQPLAGALRNCARWHRAPEVFFGEAVPMTVAETLTAAGSYS